MPRENADTAKKCSAGRLTGGTTNDPRTRAWSTNAKYATRKSAADQTRPNTVDFFMADMPSSSSRREESKVEDPPNMDNPSSSIITFKFKYTRARVTGVTGTRVTGTGPTVVNDVMATYIMMN